MLASCVVVMLLSVASAGAQTTAAKFPALKAHTFDVPAAAELIATVTATCQRCSWDVEGREAVVLRLTFEGRQPITLPLTRQGRADYRVFLGPSRPGSMTLTIDQDVELSARDLRDTTAATVDRIAIEHIAGSAATDVRAKSESEGLSLAPFVYARPNTIGRFTDVPLYMYYEIEPIRAGSRYRYTVIFSNEDGGTPTDRLMATWGRTTDIEYIYSVEVDERGAIISEDLQGPDHKILPFKGQREGRHPLLFVSTQNNMVLDRGDVGLRYAPAPARYGFGPLNKPEASREAVMDRNPWLYEVMAKELVREGKIVPNAPPGKDSIPDPRQFAFLEGCGVLGESAVSFSLQVNGTWIASDRGVAEYRIARDGCFRAAVPLPTGATIQDVRAIRVHAHNRRDKKPNGTVEFQRISALFGLDEHYRPLLKKFAWDSSASIVADGPPIEIPIPR